MDERFIKGLRAEDRVENILIKLSIKGVIRSFRRTKRNSREDNIGVDFWVLGNNGLIMPLQVKSSDTRVEIFNILKKYEIPAINAWDENVEAQIIKLMSKRGLIRHE